MRVLFTSTAGRGHVGPMLPLAHALREQRHDVTWATVTANCEWLAREGFAAHPAGLVKAIDWAELLSTPEIRDLAPAERPDATFHHVFGPRRAAPMLEDLLPIVDAVRPDLIVSEQAELAAPIAAARAGVASVTHGFGSLLPEIRLSRAAEAVAPLWREHGLEPRPHAGTYDHLYIHIYPPALDGGTLPAYVGAVQSIRPAVAAPRTPKDGPPLVYVTFGTVFNDDLTQLRTIVDGVRELRVRILATVGPNGDPAALGDQPEHVEIARFIPQAQTLPRCAAVVSHGGSGTFLAALAHGLPQLLVPQAADQFLNAAGAERSGAGLALRDGELTADAVRGAVQRLLDDDTIASAAARGADEIAAMPSPAEVAEVLGARYG